MRSPKEIIGEDAEIQLIFEGYQIVPTFEFSEMKRKLGGGCDANEGGVHAMMKDGKYAFCINCGESLRGVRYNHEKRSTQ